MLTSLPSFLTMYRAYSRRELLYEYAHQIARGECLHPSADVRVSIPHPNAANGNATETPERYAKRAMEEMTYYRSCLLPEQRLFVTFPRQTFNMHTNLDYFNAFVDLWDVEDPAFDFAGQPLPLSQTLPLLQKLRGAFPSAFICYHHGEVCPHIPFADRIRDTMHLLPYVDRVGHGLCLGLAVLGINPDAEGDETDDATLESNRDAAYQCLHKMANAGTGIEVSPTCNITLGGARNEDILRQYVGEFLRVGVNVYVATDDPGFLGTTLEREVALLKGVDDG